MPIEKKAKRRAKQRWPYVKGRTYPNGASAWMVDARTKEGGERKTFETLAEAETFAEQCRARREGEGLRAFGNADLARFGKTVQDAISFYLDYLRRQEHSVPVKDAVAKFLSNGEPRSPRYAGDLRARLSRFEGAFGERLIGSISPEEITKW